MNLNYIHVVRRALVIFLLGFMCHAAATGQPASTNQISFVSLGDWGCAGIDSARKESEQTVADAFANVSANLSANFILNTGDNFYYYGVKSIDDPLWQTNFEKVYNQPSLMKKWYSVLGNHDYGFNPEAQVQYTSPNNNRWVLPSRYYSQRVQLGNTKSYATLIMLDTNPCIANYRDDDPAKWDPCGSDIKGPTDCKFHQNVVRENCTAQYVWLKKLIPRIPKDDWVIAVGHHPLDEIDVLDFVSLLQDAKIHLYLNGHTHAMSVYTVNDLPCVTSGGGCMVNLEKEEEPTTKKKSTLRKYVVGNLENYHVKHITHNYTEVWNKKSAGFTTHTFSMDMKELTTTVMDGFGQKMYEFSVKK